jgi:polysaccharide pyruvyl transferase WcaK-like protein
MPDPVYGLRLPEPAVPEAVRRLRAGWRLIAVNLRPWAEAGRLGTHAAVAHALTRVAEGGDVAFVGVPMQAGERVDDDAIRAVFDQLGSSAPTVVLPHESAVEEVLGALAAADAVLSMRLHASLLAHRLGVPAVGLAYQPKVSEHFAELGLAHRSLPLTASADEIAAALGAALALGGLVEADVSRRVELLEEGAGAALDALAAQLSDAPPMPLPTDGRDWLAPPLEPE